MSAWIFLSIIVAFGQVSNWIERRYGITGIAWGGRDTEHPGWWWTRKETIYVRRAGNGEKHGG